MILGRFFVNLPRPGRLKCKWERSLTVRLIGITYFVTDDFIHLPVEKGGYANRTHGTYEIRRRFFRAVYVGSVARHQVSHQAGDGGAQAAGSAAPDEAGRVGGRRQGRRARVGADDVGAGRPRP